MVKNTVDLLKNGVLVTSHNGENYNMCVFLQKVKLFDNIWRLLEDLIITLSRARPTKLELWWYINHFKIFPTRPRTYLPPAVGPGTKFQITKLIIEWKPSYINLKVSHQYPGGFLHKTADINRYCLICWNSSGYRCLYFVPYKLIWKYRAGRRGSRPRWTPPHWSGTSRRISRPHYNNNISKWLLKLNSKSSFQTHCNEVMRHGCLTNQNRYV